VSLVVLVVLFFSFRHFTAVILPLLTVLIAVIWCMGAMPLVGVDLSVISTVLPVILVAVGSAYGIHVVTHYIEDMKESGVKPELFTKDEHQELIIRLSLRIGQAVFLAALTTFVGFSSFCFTRVLPIREFGFFSSFGVIVSYLVAVTLIPSLLLIRGPKPMTPKHTRRQLVHTETGPTVFIIDGNEENAENTENAEADRLRNNEGDIERFFMPIIRKKKTVIAVVAAVLALSVYGVSKVVIDNVFVEYFRSSTDISRSDKFIRDKFGGSKVVSVVALADTPELLLSPESLKAMDDLSTYLQTRVPETGKTLGFTDLIKRINQVYNAEESPEGIRARVDAAVVPDAFGGFGFGDFGFGFGFDNDTFSDAFNDTFNDAQGFGSTSYSEERGLNDSTLPALSAERFVSLMETALGSGTNRTMDTHELVWELQKLINHRGASYYEIPAIPERYGKRSAEELQQIVSNYLILLSGNIGAYADDPLEPTAIKTTIQLRTLGEKDTGMVINEIRNFINANFPERIDTVVGGSALIESSLNNLVVQSQLISVFVSIFLVFVILTLCNRSFAAGLIGIMPLSITVLINFAIMGLMGIKLNIGPSMVASVSVGIGIDYTIHYIEAFKREYLAAGGKGDFLIRAYATSGKAILINALSVGAGFVVLLFSQFIMLQHLGLLIAITMGTCALTSLTVIPVLLLIFMPKFIYKCPSQGHGATES
jgi:predicted RND superfamily exporter protein